MYNPWHFLMYNVNMCMTIHNTPPARILSAIGVDGKLKSGLEWPNLLIMNLHFRHYCIKSAKNLVVLLTLLTLDHSTLES